MTNLSSNFRREIPAWLFITAAVVLVLYRTSDSGAGSDASALRIASARIRALILIEAASLQKPLRPAVDKRVDDQMSHALMQIDEEAVTPADKLRVAIITGEIAGKERALAELDRLMAGGDAELAEDIAAVQRIYAEGPQSLTSESRERLIGRYGDFGKIALAFGLAPDEEPRKSIRKSAIRAFLVAGILGVGIIGLIFLALAGVVLAVVLAARKQIQRAFVPQVFGDPILLDMFAAYLIAFVSFGWIARYFGLRSIGWNWLVVVFIAILLMWARKREVTFEKARLALGLHQGRGALQEIAAGLMGYLTGFVIIVPGIVMSFILIRWSGARASHPIVGLLLSGDRWQILGVYALACVLAPVTEELMFRGALFGHLRGRWNWMASASFVSLIFALLHPQGWAAVPALAAIAMVLAGIREWRGSLIASTAAHSFNNFVAVTAALLLLRQ